MTKAKACKNSNSPIVFFICSFLKLMLHFLLSFAEVIFWLMTWRFNCLAFIDLTVLNVAHTQTHAMRAHIHNVSH